ncbi:Ditrans,polycis-polyprenyl diphosphate synthase ((2E,6E)-farnesyl diphosphate specific) [Bertholletia excelsa]
MATYIRNLVSQVIGTVIRCLRKCIFRILSFGPLPQHIAFVLDGNRRYAKKWNLKEGAGYRIGFFALMAMLKYCYELGIKYVTVYAFSMDNFKRRPDEVQYVMDLMQEKIEWLLKEQNTVNKFGMRVYIIGDLKCLTGPVRSAAERIMAATAGNSNLVLSVCVAYSSTDEIANAVKVSCEEKRDQIIKMNGLDGFEMKGGGDRLEVISMRDVDRNLYMSVAPEANLVVRTSGVARLSNFMLWQTGNCLLYFPTSLWPEIGLRHLIWATFCYQRHHGYLEKTKKLDPISIAKKED